MLKAVAFSYKQLASANKSQKTILLKTSAAKQFYLCFDFIAVFKTQ